MEITKEIKMNNTILEKNQIASPATSIVTPRIIRRWVFVIFGRGAIT
jgi:hypothetical protein